MTENEYRNEWWVEARNDPDSKAYYYGYLCGYFRETTPYRYRSNLKFHQDIERSLSVEMYRLGWLDGKGDR